LTPLGVAKFKESNPLCCGKTNRKLGREVAISFLTADPPGADCTPSGKR
jgi:hypothetical protein